MKIQGFQTGIIYTPKELPRSTRSANHRPSLCPSDMRFRRMFLLRAMA